MVDGIRRNAAAQSREEPMRVYPKQALSGMLVACLCFLTAAMLMPRTGNAQDAELTKSMAALKDRTAKLGDPKIQGKAAVGGKDVPALFFGATKMNNNVAVVDEVAKTGGKGIAATLFVKDGDQFVRVATTVAKPDKSGRAIRTALDVDFKKLVRPLNRLWRCRQSSANSSQPSFYGKIQGNSRNSARRQRLMAAFVI